MDNPRYRDGHVLSFSKCFDFANFERCLVYSSALASLLLCPPILSTSIVRCDVDDVRTSGWPLSFAATRCTLTGTVKYSHISAPNQNPRLKVDIRPTSLTRDGILERKAIEAIYASSAALHISCTSRVRRRMAFQLISSADKQKWVIATLQEPQGRYRGSRE